MLVPVKDIPEAVAREDMRPAHEFLVVGNDPAVFRSVAHAIRQVSGRMSCASSVAAARDYVARRKVDGLVVDMALSGAVELVQRVRAASSSKSTVIFACMNKSAETQGAIRNGANFALHRPLVPDKIARVFTLAASMMAAEKRRYFRYPLMVPVNLKVNGRDVESTMSNLSQGGMAVWSVHQHPAGSKLQFAFELPFGGQIRGQGEVAWTNAEGLAGVKFNILPGPAYTSLSNWISLRESPAGE